MLIEYTLFGMEDKVAEAIKLLREHEPSEGYYLCFSGGKDSVVIYDLAVKAGVKFDAHHNITTVEPPELMKFIRDNYPNVISDHPPMTMHQLIVKNKIPPLRMARYCCEYLKERGGQGRVKITGIRSEESPRRAKRGQVEDNRHGGLFVHVVKNWTTADIWQYIRLRGLPYCRLYDEGFTRIGLCFVRFKISPPFSVIWSVSPLSSNTTNAPVGSLLKLIGTKCATGIRGTTCSIGGLRAGNAVPLPRTAIPFPFFPKTTAGFCRRKSNAEEVFDLLDTVNRSRCHLLSDFWSALCR